MAYMALYNLVNIGSGNGLLPGGIKQQWGHLAFNDSSEGILQGMLKISILDMSLKITNLQPHLIRATSPMGQWVTTCVRHLNSLCAIFFRGKINMYLHFMSLLHIDMTQVLKILPQVRPVPTYSTQSISLLLMSWRCKEPGHQQPWYWPR